MLPHAFKAAGHNIRIGHTAGLLFYGRPPNIPPTYSRQRPVHIPGKADAILGTPTCRSYSQLQPCTEHHAQPCSAHTASVRHVSHAQCKEGRRSHLVILQSRRCPLMSRVSASLALGFIKYGSQHSRPVLTAFALIATVHRMAPRARTAQVSENIVGPDVVQCSSARSSSPSITAWPPAAHGNRHQRVLRVSLAYGQSALLLGSPGPTRWSISCNSNGSRRVLCRCCSSLLARLCCTTLVSAITGTFPGLLPRNRTY
ncbi:hypothetical protein C8Q77DRAFT_682665 [Trametes polyzona]|nr:hypothetical protein C8Q77DRAFT_682665 [Trametes polyzona]